MPPITTHKTPERSSPATHAPRVAATRGASGGGVGGSRAAYPESVTRLIDELAQLPGIGRRSAERLAFHILKAPSERALGLARAISDVKQRVRHCAICYNMADAADAVDSASAAHALCAVCSDASRDRAMVMVVEQPKDLIALEHTGAYRGVYHVLMGRISPLENIGPGDITLGDLVKRVNDPAFNVAQTPVRELVLALNPTLESEGTALYLAQKLADTQDLRITRLARGVPTGAQLEYASKAVLADAIEGRRNVANQP